MSLEVVADIIVDTVQCDREAVVADARLEDLGLDSLLAMTVIFDLEEHFDIEIPTESINEIQTVGDIVERIEQLRSVQAA